MHEISLTRTCQPVLLFMVPVAFPQYSVLWDDTELGTKGLVPNPYRLKVTSNLSTRLRPHGPTHHTRRLMLPLTPLIRLNHIRNITARIRRRLNTLTRTLTNGNTKSIHGTHAINGGLPTKQLTQTISRRLSLRGV